MILFKLKPSGFEILNDSISKIQTDYRYDLEKQEAWDWVARERLTEPRVTMEWL